MNKSKSCRVLICNNSFHQNINAYSDYSCHKEFYWSKFFAHIYWVFRERSLCCEQQEIFFRQSFKFEGESLLLWLAGCRRSRLPIGPPGLPCPLYTRVRGRVRGRVRQSSKLRQKPTISWTADSDLSTTYHLKTCLFCDKFNLFELLSNTAKSDKNENSRKVFAKIPCEIGIPTTFKMQIWPTWYIENIQFFRKVHNILKWSLYHIGFLIFNTLTFVATCYDLMVAPNAEPYVFDTGDMKQLINLGGTIPILHKHQTLNISVKVTRHWPRLPHRLCNPVLTRSGLGWTTQSRHLFATLFPPRTQNFPSHPTSTILVSLREKKYL